MELWGPFFHGRKYMEIPGFIHPYKWSYRPLLIASTVGAGPVGAHQMATN